MLGVRISLQKGEQLTGPTRRANSSVAKPSWQARGMIARNAVQNVAVSLTSLLAIAMETGTLDEDKQLS